MSLTAPQDTLAHQLARPLTTPRDMGWVDTKQTAARVKDLVYGFGLNGTAFGDSPVSPETEALRFYLLQHAMAIVRQRKGMDEPLGALKEISELYHTQCGETAQRMFTYLLFICTREARHPKWTPQFSSLLKKTWGDSGHLFASNLQHKSSGTAPMMFSSAPPDMPIGKYTDMLCWMFRKGQYGSSFGGPKWAVIADCLTDFVNGKLSAEMMLDTAFTLAHNGGPIFNKGMGWEMYDGGRLLQILDIQASGQIPNLCCEAQGLQLHGPQNPYNPKVPTVIRKLYKTLLGLIGDEFRGTVNWALAEKHGKTQWHQQKMWQQAHVPKTPEQIEAEKLAEAQAAQKALNAQLEKEAALALEQKTYLTLDVQGTKVKKKERA